MICKPFPLIFLPAGFFLKVPLVGESRGFFFFLHFFFFVSLALDIWVS